MEKIFFSNIFIFLIIFNNLSFLSRAKYKKKKIHFYEYSLMIFSVLIEIYNWFFVARLSASIRRSIVTNGSFLIHMLRFCAPVNRRAINQFHGSSIMLITSATGIFTISDHTLRDLFHILILLNISLSLNDLIALKLIVFVGNIYQYMFSIYVYWYLYNYIIL